jgi:hypothetical protein
MMASNGVGYGNPPDHSRFKPGHSGNPRGRPKGKISLSQLLEKHLNAKVTITSGGQQKQITRREALIIGLVGDALKGKDRVRKELLNLMLFTEAQAATASSDAPSSADDEAVIQSLLHRFSFGDAAKIKPAEAKAKAEKVKAFAKSNTEGTTP